jgi:hypothetical protein
MCMRANNIRSKAIAGLQLSALVLAMDVVAALYTGLAS